MNIPNKRSANHVLWIGLAEVKPRKGNNMLGKDLGAFVPCIALVRDPKAFEKVIRRALNKEGFSLIAIENIERLSTRMRRKVFKNDLLEVIASISENNPVGFGTFHSYGDV